MKAHTIALTGVSGVGKTTLAQLLAATTPLEHLQASALIKEGRSAAGEAIAQDELRLIDLDENQRFLVDGFRLAAASRRGLIILDAHTVIEKEDEIVPIGAAVFRAIGINSMTFLEDDPAAIAERRRGDGSRIRPPPNVDRIAQIQKFAREQAVAICSSLEIALHVRRPNQHAAIATALVGDSLWSS